MTELLLSSEIENIYLPQEALIKEVIVENSSISTFVLEFTDPVIRKEFSYKPGQFVMVTVPGQGEAPISISSTPTRKGNIHLSVRKAGRLTNALHGMHKGECIGIRGPYGRPFPVEELSGRNLLFVAGGIGLAPLRSVIDYCLDHEGQYGSIILLYGSRSPSDIAFGADIEAWKKSASVEVHLSVDVSEPGWKGRVGLVTSLLDEISVDAKDCSALLCGPSVMIDAVSSKLFDMGFSPEDIIATLERNMKCGVGLCGHCYMDGRLVCRHGPVFRLSQLGYEGPREQV